MNVATAMHPISAQPHSCCWPDEPRGQLEFPCLFFHGQRGQILALNMELLSHDFMHFAPQCHVVDFREEVRKELNSISD